MSRELCDLCHYPTVNCLCNYIQPVKHQTQVIVLQHPTEVKNAKNTVRLLTLMSDNIDVLIGETEQDFAQLKQLVGKNPEQYLMLFPAPTARSWSDWQSHWQQELSSQHSVNSEQQRPGKTLIVIDGTWKKAKKILFLNPWLEQLNALKIDDRHSQYAIRHTHIRGALSTIEATAFALNEIENINVEPFIQALQGLNTAFTQQMPTHVKQRYQP